MVSRIVVVGSANTDLIVMVSAIPAPGETVIGGDLTRAPGGKGANQAVAAARLGAEVTFIGCLGSDDFGIAYREHLERENLYLRFLKITESRPSGVALIFVGSDGENSIAVAPGANHALLPEDIDHAEEAFKEADVVLLQLEIPLETVLRAAQLGKRYGATVILNPAPAPAPAFTLTDELLSCVDVLTPNQHEARVLAGGATSGDAAKQLLRLGVKRVVMTQGAEGASIFTSQRERKVKGRPVIPVDTTGAGDCFNGALAVALSEGRSLEEAADWANAAASLSVRRMGAQPGLPTRQELEYFHDNSPR